MDINNAKMVLNRLNQLNDREWLYDVDGFLEDDEIRELIDVFSKSVGIQMWALSKRRDKNYQTSSYDISKSRYKGYDEEKLEKYRLNALQKIEDEADPFKKVDLFLEYGRTLKENMEMLDFLTYIANEKQTLTSMEVCSNMFAAKKYSLTDIQSILPWLKISDIYGLSIMLNQEMPITEEELEQIKEEYYSTGKPNVLKSRFGEPKN